MKPAGLLLIVLALAAGPLPAQEVVEYYHLDGLGSVRAVSDQAGNLVERHDYLPYGEECTTGPCAASPGAGGGQPRKFAGKERDAESGLDYFGARYYGARIARFTTVDPRRSRNPTVDPQLWNAYSYARDNPLRYHDPDGRKVRVKRNGDNVTLTLKVQFVRISPGPNGPRKEEVGASFRGWFQRVAEDTWKGRFGKYTVTTRVEPGKDNTIYLVVGNSDVFAASPTGSQAYDAVTWGSQPNNRGRAIPVSDQDWVMAHEIGHLMHLEDQYIEDKDPVTGLVTGSHPKPGETDIMSDSGRPIEERTIGRIVKDLPQ